MGSRVHHGEATVDPAGPARASAAVRHRSPLTLIPRHGAGASGEPPATALAAPRADGRPDPALWTIRLTQALAEVLAGARPAVQLAELISLEVRRMLERGAGRFGARPGSPPQRPLVASVHVTEPTELVIEACAVITTGSRARVVAVRLDAAGDSWRCTALQIG